MRAILFFTIAFAGFLGVCTSSTKVLLTEQLPTRRTKVRDIMVYLGGPPLKARPLALLAVARHGENSVWAVEALKAEASELGADAITNLTISYSKGVFPELRVEGVAVKYGK